MHDRDGAFAAARIAPSRIRQAAAVEALVYGDEDEEQAIEREEKFSEAQGEQQKEDESLLARLRADSR